MKNQIRGLLNEALKELIHPSITIKSISPQGGGDINEAAHLHTSHGSFFVKWNDSQKYPRMFELERNGLGILGNQGKIDIPKIIGTAERGNVSFLILEWIESISLTEQGWVNFGSDLSKMHRNTSDLFGLDEDNYIGRLHQYNDPCDNWVEFFIINRLDGQLEMAINSGIVAKSHSKKFQKLYSKLDSLIPKEPPALVHGDLWSGNFIPIKNRAVLIDPAVYYGHREMDIAMMNLFGGFKRELFNRYNEEYPMETGWEERLNIHNLYPLLVHVNLFGGHYVGQVENILSRYI